MIVRSRNYRHPIDQYGALPASRERGLEKAGCGWISLKNVAGRTVPTRLQANSPLRLLAPRTHGSAAWIYAGTYGGGLVGGDRVQLQIDADDDVQCFIGTQASTKVYRTDELSCRQELRAKIGERSLLVSGPDPVVCFAGSRYQQIQRFDLADRGSLVAIDAFTSGRCGRGERWAMDGYESRTEVFAERRCVFRDVLRLDPADGPIGGAMRMGLCNCFASLLVVGEPLGASIGGLLKFVAAQPLGGDLLIGASAIQNGVIIRIAGSSSEAVMMWLRQRLTFLIEPLGGDCWARKW